MKNEIQIDEIVGRFETMKDLLSTMKVQKWVYDNRENMDELIYRISRQVVVENIDFYKEKLMKNNYSTI